MHLFWHWVCFFRVLPPSGKRSSTILSCAAIRRSSTWLWACSSSRTRTGPSSGPGCWKSFGSARTSSTGDSSTRWDEMAARDERAMCAELGASYIQSQMWNPTLYILMPTLHWRTGFCDGWSVDFCHATGPLDGSAHNVSLFVLIGTVFSAHLDLCL